jgi:hypothetical protein
MKKLNVRIIGKNSYGTVHILINNKIYKYQFSDILEFENFYYSYWRNKGRFLNQIKKFLIKE